MGKPAHIQQSELINLHARMLARDPTAAAVFVDLLLVPLSDALKRHPRARGFTELVENAVEDSLIAYIKAPEKYVPAKRGLWGYLLMAATGDLRNAVDREHRRRRREKTKSDVEDDPQGRNKVMTSAASKLDAKDAGYRAWIGELRVAVDAQFSDPAERAVAHLVIKRVSGLRPFAEAMGVSLLPIEQQRAEVKRCKDRVSKRLQRLGERLCGTK